MSSSSPTIKETKETIYYGEVYDAQVKKKKNEKEPSKKKEQREKSKKKVAMEMSLAVTSPPEDVMEFIRKRLDRADVVRSETIVKCDVSQLQILGLVRPTKNNNIAQYKPV
ncbi:hypothetical protein YC2023_023217 [Brassica napus]